MKTPTTTVTACAVLLLTLASHSAATAQTDFYNLDKDRPLRVEDAYATKRYAFELKASPLTLSQTRDGTIRYRPEVELKHGLLPGLEVSAGLGLAVDRPPPGQPRRASTELELSSLLNLTTETRWLPALGVRVIGHIPLEGQDDGSTVEVKGLATRSLAGPLRAHVNGGWAFGDHASERWWAGLALDYVFPFRHLLLLAETYVAEPAPADTLVPAPPPANGADGDGTTRVHSTAGLRYQLSPVIALDGGVGRSWTGSSGADWLLTLGLTYEFGVRAIMPVARR